MIVFVKKKKISVTGIFKRLIEKIVNMFFLEISL